MTVRASGRSPDSTATQPVREFRAFLDALDRLGYDAGDLLAAVGLNHRDLEDPDGQVPCAATGALVCRALECRRLPNMALRLALEMPLGVFPLLDYLVVSSDTVGEGFSQLLRYLRITSSPVVLEIFAGEDPVRVVASSPGIPFAVEHLLALSVLHMREETDGRLKVASVELAHRPDDVKEFERVLRCPVHEQAGWSGLVLPAASWRLPLRRGDAALKGVLERQAKETVARSKKGAGAAFEVGRLLVTRIAGRDTRLQVVARQLGTSARTLQRKLAAEGASYHALLEEARRRAAEGYLAEPTLSVGEVGYLLGYSEPAAFHRAFRRWHRMTPAAYRQRAAARSNG